MAGKSDYLEGKILEHVLKATSYSSPATVYLALYTAAPSDSGGGTEVSGNGYARQSIAFAAQSGGSISNSGTVTFPTATGGSWGTVTHFGIFDASSNGNLLYWGALGASKTVANGDTIAFAASSVTVTED